ncbi:acetyl-CoA carboxylase biotin carboxylase subunit [Tuwongella immobilis]|uniref:Biotin carboxylase n=1 Tax=Tuwongella immobilis TaxID=692036 RepID=A0A6C2YUB6_9BACT|nr:acetyl-CoA carboxylase biotin carboxylase subunit [Tuwongella immobilis]VIP04947.1 acetyl- carboxylase biotin carboxylase subunit : Biotin carboxylase OS=Planctomyces maris DSM 8797 GN=PM8797T_07462 PE=4 SV=1: CPSase_L_chain: CPSase_L_D2: Biotin_carb_C [Tuwongella immobilis]VTS07252.1 acetyl- carboxylase biotin carboxylase subunit : Biotin carboxylase OS=Planctomyces maris DSM 8797 GN=PM8797T_07462 PE=4 SV=1: CPSase_L_chain: CPSase_L_D2: Biotin_carb_C [Tuwongella immobilis]
MFQRIMVANRGEIALRVIRACRDLGIEVVAVYSEADRGAAYLELADEAICIGPGPATESYLKIPRIISAAEIAGVEAIHPGYGFLSENAHFAEVCRGCKIEFIGPPEEAMRRLGNKNAAKQIARQANVPVVPGSDGLITDPEQAKEFANRVGYPVLIKAAAGGGGRGMRVARNELDLVSGLQAAAQEAEAAFKDGSVYLEKYLDRPRHIEVQILGDRFGNVVHLYERDCSLQRRHQKLVEESPAPNLPVEVREAICAAAVRLAKTAGYYSAGTCEFLLDQQNNFYFIEVNARIQVEHPVSELVTGVDLVREQIRIAAGEALGYTQSDIVHRGCAIECRINAEDPANDFRPSPGQITTWRPPGGPGVRLDSHVITGYKVPPNYDSLVAKLLVHQPTRTEALAAMRRALREFVVEGIKTTIPLHRDIFNTAAFVEGKVDTTLIERTFMQSKPGGT